MSKELPSRVVLVIEDDPADRALIRRLLLQQPRRYEVREAASGVEGLAACAATPPDCVLLDFHLPDMEGTEVLRGLAHGEGLVLTLPVAMLSGVEDDAAATAALQAGAQDYLLKDGLTARALARAIENTIEKHAVRLELEAQRAAVDLRNHRLELLRDELEANMAELAEATRAKDRFLAVMSHEMRTPLNAILGYTDLLSLELDGRLSDAQKQHLDRMRVGSRHLLDLINDVLDITRADARKLDVDLRPVDLTAVLEEVTALLEVHATAKGVALVSEACAEPLPLVQADLQRLRQVLTNLVGNAIKFTDEGSVTVRCALEPATGEVLVDVRDTGIGIDPSIAPLVFNEFYQGKDELTRRHGGSGLGLAISQRLAQLMGGEIEVRSVLGEGSTFTLRLRAAARDAALRPVDVAHHDTRMANAGRRADAASAAAPVSVVAFGDAADALGELSQRVNPAVRLAWTTDPLEVTTLAAAQQATLVVLDASSAGGAAWRAALAMQERADLTDTAVLLVPSLAAAIPDDASPELDLGWVALVPKPFTANQLTQAVHAAADGPSRGPDVPAGDAAAYDVLVVDDDLDSRRVAARFLIEAELAVREAADGESALLAMRGRAPDVVVLDLMMPVLDGFGVLAAMRADPMLMDIPVVVLTAKTLTDGERRFLSRTAVRVLQKGAHRLADVAALVLRAAARTRRTDEPADGVGLPAR